MDHPAGPELLLLLLLDHPADPRCRCSSHHACMHTRIRQASFGALWTEWWLGRLEVAIRPIFQKAKQLKRVGRAYIPHSCCCCCYCCCCYSARPPRRAALLLLLPLLQDHPAGPRCCCYCYCYSAGPPHGAALLLLLLLLLCRTTPPGRAAAAAAGPPRRAELLLLLLLLLLIAPCVHAHPNQVDGVVAG